MVLGLPGQSVAIGAIADSILTNTGLSRNVFSMLYTCSTITGCFLLLPGGVLVDKIGIRKTTLFALSVCTIVFFVLGNIQFLCAKVSNSSTVRSWFTVAFLYFNLSVLRCFGPNMFPMLGRMQIAKAFGKAPGIAVGLSGAFFSIVTGYWPSIMRFLAKNENWQNAYKTLGIVGCVALVIFFMLFHDIQPERTAFVQNPAKPSKYSGITSQKEFLRMPIFWGLMSVLCLTSFIGTGVTVHICDIFQKNGIDPLIAIKSYRYMGYSIVFAGLLFGHQIDKNRVKTCLLMLLFSQFFGLVGLKIAHTIFGLITYIVGTGCFWGGYGIIRQVLWSKIFKGRDTGAILSVAYCTSTIAGAIGVSVLSFAKTLSGSYFYLVYAIESILLCMTFLTIGKFPKAV
ncbi:MAG: MFS transporter [Puniceicoccales bacterium]|nr:MFS transporter [Puniceicoccales bacterium]